MTTAVDVLSRERRIRLAWLERHPCACGEAAVTIRRLSTDTPRYIYSLPEDQVATSVVTLCLVCKVKPPETKWCNRCHEVKPLAEFYVIQTRNTVATYCKSCSRAEVLRRYYEARRDDPEGFKAKKRDETLRRRYGISQLDFDQMLVEQNYSCAICRDDGVSGHHGLLHVDHDHETGRVRGLLCNRCNLALGYLEDDSLLSAMVRYLDETRHG